MTLERRVQKQGQQPLARRPTIPPPHAPPPAARRQTSNSCRRKARSPSRESGAPAETARRRPGRRRPSFAPRAPARASPAPQVGGDLADGRFLRLLLLVATDLPLPHAAGVRGAARGREGAPLLLEPRALHDLPEGRLVRGPLHRLADD